MNKDQGRLEKKPHVSSYVVLLHSHYSLFSHSVPRQDIKERLHFHDYMYRQHPHLEHESLRGYIFTIICTEDILTWRLHFDVQKTPLALVLYCHNSVDIEHLFSVPFGHLTQTRCHAMYIMISVGNFSKHPSLYLLSTQLADIICGTLKTTCFE